MIQSCRFSYAYLARLITSSAYPVTAQTLKKYLANAKKDAKEGRTDHSELKQLILASAPNQQYADADDFAAPDNN